MQKSWLKTIALAAVCGLFSTGALAASVSDEEMRSIKQYCDEMNGFGSFASEEERVQAVKACIDEEVNRSVTYGEPETSDGVEKPE